MNEIAAVTGVGSNAVYSVALCLSLWGMWTLFAKAGKPAWTSLIPFYHLYMLFEIVYGKGSRVFLLLIPLYNIYVIVKFMLDLARCFGRGMAFGIALLVAFPITSVVLGISKAEYEGPVLY